MIAKSKDNEPIAVASDAGQKRAKKPGWVRIARIVISALLIGIVLTQVSIRSALSAIAAADFRLLLLALLLNFVGATLTASRWRVLLAAQSVRTTTRFLTARWMEACFFNQFLPSTIGGDSKRIFDSWKLGASKAGAVAAVSVDRLLGAIALMVFGVVALLLSSVSIGDRGNLVTFVVSCSVILIVVAVVIFYPPGWLQTLLVRLYKKLPMTLQKFASKVESSFGTYRNDSRVLVIGLLLSVALQVNVICFYFLIGRSLGIDIEFVDYMLIIPVASVVLLLPITINGIGLREGIFAFLLAGFGVDAAVSVAFAWASFGLFTVFGVLGGIVYATRRDRHETQEIYSR